MKNTKKPARGRKFDEGQLVQSLRPEDHGDTGRVVGMSRKRTGWTYSVLLDGACKVVTRKEDELRSLSVGKEGTV